MSPPYDMIQDLNTYKMIGNLADSRWQTLSNLNYNRLSKESLNRLRPEIYEVVLLYRLCAYLRGAYCQKWMINHSCDPGHKLAIDVTLRKMSDAITVLDYLTMKTEK